MRCSHCGAALVASGRGRPPSKYCSRRCKDAARTAANRQAVKAKLAARRCENCGGPLPEDAGGKARTCSRACGVAWQNAKRAEQRRAAWLATDPTCEGCGGAIPDSRRASVKYCSVACKKKVQDARWRAKAPSYMRQYLYGITGEQFEALLASQDGGCAICGTTDWPGKGNAPHVDHDPAKGRTAVRGILCGLCNNGLGNFGDDPGRLRAAADYLERTRVLS